MIGETEVTIVTDYNVFMDSNTHHPTGKYQLASDGDIFGGGFWVPGGMVMCKNKCRCVMIQSSPDNLPGVDRTGGKCSLKQNLRCQNLILCIQKYNEKTFPGSVPQVMIKIRKHFFGIVKGVCT